MPQPDFLDWDSRQDAFNLIGRMNNPENWKLGGLDDDEATIYEAIAERDPARQCILLRTIIPVGIKDALPKPQDVVREIDVLLPLRLVIDLSQPRVNFAGNPEQQMWVCPSCQVGGRVRGYMVSDPTGRALEFALDPSANT